MRIKKSSLGLQAVLLGSLALVGAASQAAGGHWVTHEQENQVAPGMTLAQVEAVLGQPDRDVKYGSEEGRTLRYRVAGTMEQVFEVDFHADGTVASVTERYEPSLAGG